MPVAVVIKSPVLKLEIWVDTNTNPPTIHVSLPTRDAARNLWILEQAIRQVKGNPPPHNGIMLSDETPAVPWNGVLKPCTRCNACGGPLKAKKV